MKPNNVVYLKCTDESFFRMWMEFLTPFHRLTAREKDVAARFLIQWLKFKGSVQDEETLVELMWSKRSRRDMIESLKMSQAHFQVVIGKLRQSGFLIGDVINPKYIPDRRDGESRFMLQVVYDWSSTVNPIHNEREQVEE